MEHLGLGFLTGLLIWLSILVIYWVKDWDFPVNTGPRFLRSKTGSRHILNALYCGVVGAVAGLAVDIDFPIHQWLGLPYRFLHTPLLIIGIILAATCVVYLWRNAPHGRRTYTGFVVLVVGMSFITHVLQDYLLNWF